MDHFDRIFEAGGRGSDSGPNGSSEEDSGGLLRGAKQEDPFKLKKAGPPDFEFVSIKGGIYLKAMFFLCFNTISVLSRQGFTQSK